MNSATGKVNYYVTPTSLFGYSVNISDIKSIVGRLTGGQVG